MSTADSISGINSGIRLQAVVVIVVTFVSGSTQEGSKK